jgi:hypothetical protein
MRPSDFYDHTSEVVLEGTFINLATEVSGLS